MNTNEKMDYISKLYTVMIDNINEEEDLISSNLESLNPGYKEKLESILKRLNDFKYSIARCMLEFEKNKCIIHDLNLKDIVNSSVDLDSIVESLKQDIKSNEQLKQSLYIIIKKGGNQL